MSTDEIGGEQQYVSMLYDRLDDLRSRASDRLAQVLRQAGGTHQARSEREAFSVMYAQQLSQFDAAENGLCFGRLDFHHGERRYIGRIGIHDDSGDYEQLLMDWRADAARPFYLATAASPADVRRRRHIKTRGRTVVGVDDEILDLAAADPAKHEGLTGESALLAALSASRTGQMRDIVETIQAEQDWIIRSGLAGVLVVQGGPGTGKTAVALHRAAFLLYTYRRQLLKRGVLVVGPNATFLRYIGQVLPSLGETSVLLSTVADLYPGISATGSDEPATAAVKGRLDMASVMAAAVRDRQHVPGSPVEIRVDRETLRLTPAAVSRARTRARRSRRPHNQARQVFARELTDALTQQLAARIGANALGEENLLTPADVDDMRRELRAEPAVRALIERLWPVLTPQRLLADLFASADRLAAAAPRLTRAERAALLRSPDSDWTPADVPLIDEAAELLGEDDRAVRAAAERRRRAQVAYASGVLDLIARDMDDDPEILMGADLVDASRLATRHEDEESLTPAERAAGDRTWTFGHVIVDEAQELSEMAWRMLMRRCPGRSMTIVGDVAQTGSLAGASSWTDVLERYQGDRWRLAGLTINYRTPSEIMAVAADVLAAIDPALDLPRSVRDTGTEPWGLAAGPEDLASRLADATERAAAEPDDENIAVIVPAGRLDEFGSAIRASVPGSAVGEHSDLEQRVVVLTVQQAKGLEFDTVLIGDPAGILADSPRGLNDLYVALTRATKRLGVVYSGDVPKVLARLKPAGDLALSSHSSR
ncbi:MAG TPA: AAA family ATPase [Streptosporangiaceae bacterium]|nr:AAA family ATPase [Streptosporangiaceae bacterium]